MTSFTPAQLTDTSYSPLRHHNFHKAILLVVEDQDDLWAIIHFNLAKCFPDVTLHRCTTPKQTIEYLSQALANRTDLPKLILQDLYLPQHEAGLGLLENIRNLLANQQQIPVLMMSSSVEEADVRRAYRQGASFYIVKPQTMTSWFNLMQSLRQFWWDQGVLPLGGEQAPPERIPVR
ncbi:response regulator [Spirosoma koreense]